jgi:hypothetical protein
VRSWGVIDVGNACLDAWRITVRSPECHRGLCTWSLINTEPVRARGVVLGANLNAATMCRRGADAAVR